MARQLPPSPEMWHNQACGTGHNVLPCFSLLPIFRSQPQVVDREDYCGDFLSWPTEDRHGKCRVQLTIYLLVGLRPILSISLHRSGIVSIWLLITDA